MLAGLGPQKTTDQTCSKELADIYRNLSIFLEILEESAESSRSTAQRVFSVVLEEDLSSLLEEVEEYLIQGQETGTPEYFAFKTRTETVLEEVIEVLNRRCWELTVPGCDRHSIFSLAQ